MIKQNRLVKFLESHTGPAEEVSIVRSFAFQNSPGEKRMNGVAAWYPQTHTHTSQPRWQCCSKHVSSFSLWFLAHCNCQHGPAKYYRCCTPPPTNQTGHLQNVICMPECQNAWQYSIHIYFNFLFFFVFLLLVALPLLRYSCHLTHWKQLT